VLSTVVERESRSGRKATHDATEAFATSAEVLLLREGRQAARGPAAEVLAAERDRIALRLRTP